MLVNWPMLLAQSDATPDGPSFWDGWPWWSASAAIFLLLASATAAALTVGGLRRRRLAAALAHDGFQPVDLSDRSVVGAELDSLLGGSVLYRSGYITRVDGWWRKADDGVLIDIVDYREWPVPGGPRRADEAAAYYDRREMTDRSETLVVFRHEQYAALPRFLLIPNNMLMSAIGPKAGLLTFGNRRFTKRNRITSPEPGETHLLFDPPMQKLLIDNRDLSIESFADALVFARYGSAQWPGAVRRVIERGRAFCAALPGGAA